jgi:allantoin racemase
VPVAHGLQNWGRIHEELLAEIAGDGVKITQVDLPDVPVTSISSPHDVELVAPAHVRAAMRAEQEGFDAVVMGCMLDPGVSKARARLKIPVVSDASGAMCLAATMARRFSILMPGANNEGPDPGDPLMFEIVRQYGYERQLASLRRVAAPSLAFSALGTQDLTQIMLAEARTAVEEDGAEAIVGYGGLNIYRVLRQQLPVPVVSPIQASVLVAEMLVRAGMRFSRR